jgi:uncharacterized protein YdhG (YjbR/CyaY superfamily)
MRTKPRTVDEYIASYPKEVIALLEQMRSTIKKAAPGAEECISYSIPAFKLNGMLVWYAAFKNHIGLYPRGSGIDVFAKELSKYKTSKGTVQFSIDKPLPLSLIAKIVKYRVKENLGRTAKKKVSRAH